jgi:hypothetical protein
MIVTVPLMDWWTGSCFTQKPLQHRVTKEMKQAIKSINKKAPKLVLPYLSLFLYTLWSVLSHSVYDMAIENGFVSRVQQ